MATKKKATKKSKVKKAAKKAPAKKAPAKKAAPRSLLIPAWERALCKLHGLRKWHHTAMERF